MKVFCGDKLRDFVLKEGKWNDVCGLGNFDVLYNEIGKDEIGNDGDWRVRFELSGIFTTGFI